jgi:AAA family ATP:ADP antiporter
MIQNWTFTIFFCMAELWGDVCLSLLFWGLANDTTSIADAPTLYPLFGLGANMAQAMAGIVLKLFSHPGADQATFNSEVQGIMALVMVFSVVVLFMHSYIIRQAKKAKRAQAAAAAARGVGPAGSGPPGMDSQALLEQLDRLEAGGNGARRSSSPDADDGGGGDSSSSSSSGSGAGSSGSSGGASSSAAASSSGAAPAPAGGSTVASFQGSGPGRSGEAGDSSGRASSSLGASTSGSSSSSGSGGGAKGPRKPRKPKPHLAEVWRILLSSIEIRCLAVMSIAQGLCTSLMEFAWKCHIKILYPSPSDFTAFLGDVATWTGEAEAATAAAARRELCAAAGLRC